MFTSADITDEYVSPFALRWSTPDMMRNWSERRKWTLARRLWIALAEGERELGLRITKKQIAEMRRFQDDVNFARAREIEREVRHDVMAHIRAFGEQCPKAAPVIHLGATSCYVTDNAELIMIRDGLLLLLRQVVNVIDRLAAFARKHRDLPTLAFTHYQPAQLTTVGKRACLWAQDFCMDLDDLQSRLDRLAFLGVKGATGTQASFLQLFNGDHEKVRELEARVAQAMGFERVTPVTGQTYPRKADAQVLAVLSGLAQSASKFAHDLRLLQNLGEMEEPFGKSQVGSSAMAYKRNPMRCERICGLARFVIGMVQNAAYTAASQWFERTLDDSANRRLSLPEAFLGVDAILNVMLDVTAGMVVHEPVIARRVEQETPFMATEPILMAGVAAGGDRQELHEVIRRASMAVSAAMREEGTPNDLLQRLADAPAFAAVRDAIPGLADPRRFVGRAPEQVDEFLDGVIEPIRRRYADEIGMTSELRA